MKKKLIFLCFIVFIGYVLLCPGDAIAAAGNGLVLWYEKVLPTLLPFAIVSNILIYSNYLQYLTRLFAPILSPVFSVSGNRLFCAALRLSVRIPDGKQKLCRTVEKPWHLTGGSRCALCNQQQYQSYFYQQLYSLLAACDAALDPSELCPALWTASCLRFPVAAPGSFG